MDIERRMEFIVENLAALTVSQQKTDRQIRGLQKIVKTGMSLLVKMERRQTEMAKRIDVEMTEIRQALKDLSSAQKRTDARFDRWLDSFENGSNGHRKKKPN